MQLLGFPCRSMTCWASVASILRFDNSADVPGEKLNTGERAIRWWEMIGVGGAQHGTTIGMPFREGVHVPPWKKRNIIDSKKYLGNRKCLFLGGTLAWEMGVWLMGRGEFQHWTARYHGWHAEEQDLQPTMKCLQCEKAIRPEGGLKNSGGCVWEDESGDPSTGIEWHTQFAVSSVLLSQIPPVKKSKKAMDPPGPKLRPR